MSATPPTDPQGPKDSHDAGKKATNNAILWAVLAAVFAVGTFAYSEKADQEKKNFYLIASGVGALVAAFNAYNAFTLSQKAKQPPTAPK